MISNVAGMTHCSRSRARWRNSKCPVKAMLTELPVGELTRMLDEALADGGAANKNPRALLQQFAERHGVPL